MEPTDDIEFLKKVLDTSPTMIAVTWADPDRPPLFISKEFERATGLVVDPDDDAWIEPWWARLHPDDREAQAAWRGSFSDEHGPPPPITYRFETPRGWRWYTTSMSLFRPAEGDEPAQIMLITSDATDLRRAQEEQEETRRFYERILGASSVMIAAVDGQTRKRIWATPGMERLLGMTAEEFNDLPPEKRWELIHPDDRANEQARIAAVRAGEIEDVGATHRLMTPEGWRWSRIEYTRLEPTDGPPLRIEQVTDVHDQTVADRKRLTVLDEAPIPAAIRNLTEDRLVYVNKAWTQATGYDVESFEAAHPGEPLAFVHPDDREAVITAGASRSGVKPYAARFRGPDGEYRWYQTDITRLDTAPGEPEEALFFHTDITELIEFQARSDVMVERNPVAQVVFDLDSNIIEFANHALFELSGRTVDEWNDLGPPHIRAERIGTPPEDYDAIFVAIDEALETGMVTSVRRRWLHADGSMRWLECRYRSFPDPLRPDARRVLMAAADITAQVADEVQREALLESAPVLVTITDTNTGLREYVSPEFTRVTGFTLDEYNALTRDEQVARVHPDDRDRVNAGAQAFRQTGGEEGEEITYRLQTVDGWRWITTRARILSHNPDGSAARLMITGVDVHDAIEADTFRTAVLNGSATGITVYDLHADRPEFVNAEFTALTGYRIEDIDALGERAVESMVPVEDLAVMIELSLDAFRGGTVAEVRHRIRHLDGSIAWYASRFNRVDAGEGPKLLISSIAVTAQMEAEARSEAILEASPFSVVIHEPDSSTTDYVNPTYTRITGFTADDLTAMDREGPHSIAADDAGKENAAVDRAIATGRPASALVRVLTSTGDYRWMDSWYVSYPDLEGRFPRRVLITSLDITDRIDAEAQSQTILETSPSIVLVYDPDEVVTEFANATFTRITGYTADELNVLDRSATPSLVHPDDLDSENRAIDEAISTGRPVALTHRLLTADGTYRWLDTQYQHFPDASGLRPRRLLVTSIDVTDRINAETLSASLSEASPIGLLVYDVERREYEWTNPAFVDATGYTAESLNERAAHTYPVITVPDDVEDESAAIDQAIATGRPTEIQHRYRCADGSIRSFESRFTALPDADGTPSNRVLVSSIDITDRLAAEQREQALLATSPAMTIVVDVDGQQLLYANRRFLDMTGSTELPDGGVELFGANVPAEDLGTIGVAVRSILEDHQPRVVTHRYRAPDGEIRHLQSHFSPFPDPLGAEANLLVITSIDITERVAAEALSQTILASSPAPTVVVDATDGRTVYANPAFTAATGHTADSLNAMPFDDMLELTPADERALVDAAIAETLATGEVTSVERTYRSADGTVRWFDSRFLRLPSDDGNEVVVTAIDTSERRAVEEALEAERIRLERANRDLQEFVYIASHDLQEPLRTMTAFTELLALELPEAISDDAQTSMQFIQQGAGRMRALVLGLLEYSRIGAGRDVREIDMNTLAAEVVEDLGDQISREGASVEVGPLPTVRGDRTELRLVLQNLISNAIKFRAPDRDPVVRISAEALEDDGWRFEIVDNGIGIDERHVDRIFAIFQRLHARDTYEGTGMGLAHAKRAVANHGGRIGVESEPGVGSTFWFTLSAEGTP